MDEPQGSVQNGQAKKNNFIQAVGNNIKKIRLQHFFARADGTAMPYMKAIHETANLIVAQLQGPIDINTVPVVHADFQGKLERYLDKHILLDFKAVTHVDSSTIANLVFLLTQLQQRNRKLGITHIDETLENYITIDKVTSLIRVYKDESEALKDFGLDSLSAAGG